MPVLRLNECTYCRSLSGREIQFFEPSAVTKFQGKPFGGDVQYTGLGKYCLADRSVSVPMTLSDLEGRVVKGQSFPDDLRNYELTV